MSNRLSFSEIRQFAHNIKTKRYGSIGELMDKHFGGDVEGVAYVLDIPVDILLSYYHKPMPYRHALALALLVLNQEQKTL